ncbi:hypothetical protein DSO57_1026162 [Entomophthora muscae]|uniref:Uncharacterized protein n=1 Tax=Entomophthora muscae TaxID=34485 RepID=A0ACC2UMG2_9FUNG|nr:hypothetical protein DSO57_1026162 [Entomophthora muscae]
MLQYTTPKKVWLEKLKAKYKAVTPLLAYCQAKGKVGTIDWLDRDMGVYFGNVFILGETSPYYLGKGVEPHIASCQVLAWDQDELVYDTIKYLQSNNDATHILIQLGLNRLFKAKNSCRSQT